jgi:hypothetical protein
MVQLLAHLVAVSVPLVVTLTPRLASAQAPPPPPAVLLLHGPRLLEAQAAARNGDPSIEAPLAALRTQADQALARGGYTVTGKSVTPASGDLHDYVSLSIYWWANPTSTSGLPYVVHDGRRNPEADDTSRYDAKSLDAMVTDVETLTLAYFLTGDQRYAAHAADLLRMWFLVPDTRMNPNLRYAQIIPGRDAVRGTGIIEGRRLTRIVDSVALLGGCSCWSDNDQTDIQQWFREFETWLRTSPNGEMESRTTNNHAIWFDVQVLDYALFAGDGEAAQQISQAAPHARIDTQIAADGSLPRELNRTRSLHYSDFALQAFAELATLASRTDLDLWSYQSRTTGAAIRDVVDFLLPYWNGQSWPFQEIGSVDAFLENAQTLERVAEVYPDGNYREALSRLSAGRTELDLLRLKLGYWPD